MGVKKVAQMAILLGAVLLLIGGGEVAFIVEQSPTLEGDFDDVDADLGNVSESSVVVVAEGTFSGVSAEDGRMQAEYDSTGTVSIAPADGVLVHEGAGAQFNVTDSECYARVQEDAMSFVDRELAGQTIRIVPSQVSNETGEVQSGRVYLNRTNTTMFAAMTEQGYARMTEVSNDDREFEGRAELADLQREAQAADRGVWACVPEGREPEPLVDESDSGS